MIKHRPPAPRPHWPSGTRVMVLDHAGLPTGVIGTIIESRSAQCGRLRTYSVRALVGSGIRTLEQTGDRLRPWATT